MSKWKSLKFIASGFVLGAVFFGGISYAASGSVKIDALFGVKIIQGGVDKTPADHKPFISNGATYLPVRAVAELLDVPIEWDGKNNAVIIGKKAEGEPLGAPNQVIVPDHPSFVKASIASNQPMTINGKSYGNVGFTLTSSYGWEDTSTELRFNLNNQYKKLVLSIGMDDKSEDSTKEVLRNITFKDQDGNVLQQFALGKGTVHEQAEVNVTGVLTLVVEVTGTNSDLGDYRTSDVDFINPILTK